MANESKKEDISGLEALEELYSGSAGDTGSEEMANLDMSDISIDEILEASDNIEVSSLDTFSDVMDTSEIDALLAADESASSREPEFIDTNIDGAHDSGISIDDIDLDNFTLGDLMTEDKDDNEELNEEVTTVDGIGETSDDEEKMSEDSDVKEDTAENDKEEENIEDSIPEGSEDIPEEEQQLEEGLSDNIDNSEENTDSIDDIDLSVNEENDEADEIAERSADILPAFEETETPEEVETENEDIDIMKFLSGEDELEFLDDGEKEEDDKEDKEENVNTNYTTDGRSNVQNNVFADPLSVLNDDENDGTESEESVSVDDIDNILDDIKKDSKKKKKKKGKGFKKLFANIVDEKEIEKANKEKLEAEEAEKNKAAEAERKKLEAEEKAKLKEEKKAEKAAAKEAAKQAKEAKKIAKKEAKELRALEEESEIEGRINKAGAAIVFVILACLGVFVFVGTNMFSYNRGVAAAQSYFEKGQYEEAYNELSGLNLKEEDKILYDKVATIMHVYQQLDAYDTYCKAERYPQALDALLKGIREYEKYMPQAIELDVTDSMETIKSQMVSELSREYGITEEMAREINQITDSSEYSLRVYELAKNIANNYY